MMVPAATDEESGDDDDDDVVVIECNELRARAAEKLPMYLFAQDSPCKKAKL